jgi:chlorophyllase
MVQLLEGSCENAKGYIMMSPVDGADPFGIVDDFVIVPGVKTQFSTPTLHLAAGLDPLSTRPSFPACGPAALSNDRFYDNMNGQIFSINATAWGHADLITPCVTSACPAHPGTALNCPTADDYLSFLSASSVAFMKGVLGGDCGYFNLLTDTSKMPVNAVTKNTGVDSCPRAYCSRV